MVRLPEPLSRLINALERLPGIGPKSAARLTFYLLRVPQEDLDSLAESIQALRSSTVECSTCYNVDTEEPCSICRSPSRERDLVCVVEDPLDILAIERSGKYSGLYHVLHGVLDPLNHNRPEDLRIEGLLQRLRDPGAKVKEIILALNPSVEGEATAMFLKRKIEATVSEPNRPLITRIARGLPVGSDLEYADEVTIGRALSGRQNY